ncbi:hypothetical protein NDU88_006942 [Pleurodeles waltl]|uniref:Uncharacterized protein n=1 Tax=Pleurodeles waltl TaxID=8319 RepID=A0AAV7MLG1_PLEWA|nr:hypothetical protein NDU88_006942 [Pleurodeles waltl]
MKCTTQADLRSEKRPQRSSHHRRNRERTILSIHRSPGFHRRPNTHSNQDKAPRAGAPKSKQRCVTPALGVPAPRRWKEGSADVRVRRSV